MNRRQHPQTTPHPQLNEERSKGKQTTGPAVAGERPPSFLEPWKLDEDGVIATAENNIVVDPIGCTLPPSFIAQIEGKTASQIQQLIKSWESLYMRRIVACVNACEGISTEDLEHCTGLIARVVTA